MMFRLLDLPNRTTVSLIFFFPFLFPILFTRPQFAIAHPAQADDTSCLANTVGLVI